MVSEQFALAQSDFTVSLTGDFWGGVGEGAAGYVFLVCGDQKNQGICRFRRSFALRIFRGRGGVVVDGRGGFP